MDMPPLDTLCAFHLDNGFTVVAERVADDSTPPLFKAMEHTYDPRGDYVMVYWLDASRLTWSVMPAQEPRSAR